MADEPKGIADQELSFDNPEDLLEDSNVRIITAGDGASFNGIPYEGPVLNRKEGDPKAKQPKLTGTVYTKQFNTKDDLIEYTKIKQAVINNLARIQLEELEYNKETMSWDILINWVEYLYVHPDSNKGQQ